MVRTRRRRTGRGTIGALGATAVVLVAGCAVTPPPAGPPGSTTTTTEAPASTTTTGPTPPTTETPSPSTTTAPPPSTTTPSTTVPAEPVGTIVRVSDSIGGEGGGSSYGPTVSGDGSRVAYWSTAWDMVPDPNGTTPDVYLWDATTDTTARLSDPPCSNASAPVISHDGRVVAFTAGGAAVCVWDESTGTASRVGVGRAEGISADGRRVVFTQDVGLVFVWDATTGTTTLVTDRGYPGNPSISSDGRYVAYSAEASDLPDDTNGVIDVFVWDATTGDTVRITDGDGDSWYPDISADGRYVAFASYGSSPVPGQTSGPGVFVWDAETGVTRRASGAGVPAMSDDGRYIALSSPAGDLVPGDTNGLADVFLWDATTGTTARLTDGDGATYTPAISADGSVVTFESEAANLTDDDPDGVRDVFVWRRSG